MGAAAALPFKMHILHGHGFVVFEGDALEALRFMPAGDFACTVSSPPYNIGKAYERRTDMASYVAFIRPILAELVRVTAPGRSICWQVGYWVGDGAVLPLDYVFLPLFQELGMVLRHRIMWTFGHGLHCKHRFSGRHETILWMTKGPAAGLDVEAVREQLGEVWDIPNVKHNHPEKTAHPCQFPAAIPARLIRALTAPGERVLDCFAGSGTTGAAAVALGRWPILVERDPGFAALCVDRCAAPGLAAEVGTV